MMIPLLLALSATGFDLYREVDQVTDAQAVWARVADGRNSLSIGCDSVKSHHVMISIETDRWLQRGNIMDAKKLITYRFPPEAAQDAVWQSSEHVVSVDDRRHIVPFIRSAMKADKVIFRLETPDLSTVDLEFPLAGREKIKQAVERCGDTKTTEALSK